MTQFTMTIALCDDDALFLEALERQVRELLQAQGKAFELFPYQSAKALLSDIRGGKRFSLLLLDVMMEGLDGMELARALRRDGQRIPIIFLSGNRDYALTGYELDALRFLAKPLEPDRLREALAAAEARTRMRVLLIHNADGLHRVEVDGILYAEVWARGVLLHLSEGEQLFSVTKIGALELMLPETDFFRCHQGYIVNLAYIRTIQITDALMTDGSRVPVSRYKLTELRAHFTSYLNQ